MNLKILNGLTTEILKLRSCHVEGGRGTHESSK